MRSVLLVLENSPPVALKYCPMLHKLECVGQTVSRKQGEME